MARIRRKFSLGLFLVALLTLQTLGQTATPPPTPKDDEPIKVDTLLVNIPTIVSDRLGQKAGKEASPTPTPERDRRVVALLNDARLAAPELAADVFLGVVESKKISEVQWRREILDEAMRLADEVKYPVRLTSVYFPSTAVDTRAGYLSYAFDQKLDALSLKARILKLMLPADAARAKQVIYQIGGDLKLKPLTCEDAMSYNVNDIYAAVSAVAKASFSEKEVKDGLRSLFILPWIENLESPAQIVPVMEMIREMNGPSAEKQMLFDAFGRAIDRNFKDDRSFSDAMGCERLAGNFATLNSAMAMSEKMDLRPEFRRFLTKNTSGTRCLESKPAKKSQLPSVLEDTKFLFDEKSFNAEDFEDVEYKTKAKVVDYWRSESYRRFLDKYRTAREKKSLPKNKEDQEAQLEWELKVGELLEDLEKWSPTVEESDADVFAMKSVFYRGLSSQVPDGRLRQAVVRAFLRYLTASPLQKNSFIEWLYHAKWFAENHPAVFKETAKDFPNVNLNLLFARNRLGI